MDLLNINNFKQKNIIFSKPTKIDDRYKIKVHVLTNDKKLCKLTVVSPMLELNINWQHIRSQSIKFSLEPVASCNLSFRDIIYELEILSKSELKRVFGDLINFKSSISEIIHLNDDSVDSEKHAITTLTCKILKYSTTFTHEGKKIDIYNSNLNGLINYKFLIEFSDIWLDLNTNNCGCNFNIVQIKHFPNYYENDLIECEQFHNKQKMIDSEIVNSCSNKLKNKQQPKQLLLKQQQPEQLLLKQQQPIKPTNQSGPIAFTIDKNTLLGAINNLKKVH